MKTTVIILLLLSPLLGMAQVEHNFEMGPNNTNCHTLPDAFESSDEAISAVESAKFRFQQTMRISRIQSPRSVAFYSCGGETGYLIAVEDDEKKIIYRNVPMDTWNEFMNAENPIDFYNIQVKGQYEIVE